MSSKSGLELDAEEWQRLDASERVQRCRAFAEEARRRGSNAPPDLKRPYLELALQWSALADEIERYGLSSSPSRQKDDRFDTPR